MSDIVVRQNQTEIPPDLAQVLKPIEAKWETAILRVAAADADPRRFGVPTATGTPEALLLKRFSTLPPARRQRAGQRAVEQIAFRKRVTHLSRFVDLTSLDDARSVDARVVNPPQVTTRRMRSLAGEHFQPMGLPGRAVEDLPFGSGSLRMDMTRVVCIDETNGFLGSEAGDDEIYMTGVALDGTKNIGQIGPFKVGDFSDGDRKDFSPAHQIYAFDLNAFTTYPKAFFLTVILVEKDAGNLNETIKDIINKIAEEAIDKIVALIGGAIGSLAGPLGALIGLAVGWLVGKVVQKIISIWEDDLFTPVTLEAIIPDAAAAVNQASQVFHCKGPGEYAIRYQWKLLKPRPRTHATTSGVVLAGTRSGG